MSRAREPFHHLRETLRQALRREDAEIRPDQRASAPSQRQADDGPRERREVPDAPLGVPATDGRDGSTKLRGSPQTDPSQAEHQTDDDARGDVPR